MSLWSPGDECPSCFGLTGWVGEQARRHPLRKRLACTCEEVESMRDADGSVGDPMRRVA